MAAITIEALTFSYPGAAEPTLDALSLEIAAGEAHALLGGSGAGKTTLLNLLSGLLQPTGGTLRLGGRSLAGVAPGARRTAQVFQFPVLYDRLSLLDNLTMPLRARGVRRRPRNERGRAIATQLEFEALGMADLERMRPGVLSLYQKQLLAIGRALATPRLELLLLDEPLTAVQPSAKWRLRQTLKAVQAELGMTMVYVTHDQTEALTFADRVSVMRDGVILQSAPPRDLYERPAHTYVGHFIGSPGLNLIDAELVGETLVREDWRCPLPAALAQRCTPGPVQLGFRPEWAQVITGAAAERAADAALLPAAVAGATVQGRDASGDYGLLALSVPEPVRVQTALSRPLPQRALLHLTQLVLFQDDIQVGLFSGGES
ncbi:MAG: ABC transporter ATP-binding protein [Pseudomonadota bacterium]